MSLAKVHAVSNLVTDLELMQNLSNEAINDICAQVLYTKQCH